MILKRQHVRAVLVMAVMLGMAAVVLLLSSTSGPFWSSVIGRIIRAAAALGMLFALGTLTSWERRRRLADDARDREIRVEG